MNCINYIIAFERVAALLVAFITLGLMYRMYINSLPTLKCEIQWDVIDSQGHKVCEVIVSNIGSQNVYLNGVVLRIQGKDILPLQERVGVALPAGSSPKKFTFSQNKLHEYSKDWRSIQAIATDSSKNKHSSSIPSVGPMPSWVNSEKK